MDKMDKSISRLSIKQSIALRRLTKTEVVAPIVELTILEKRICEVFDIFDTTKSDEIDVKDLGIIIRTLGCVVTEAELQEIQVQVEDVVTNRIPLKKFLEYMSKAIEEYKYKPAEAEDLLKAFQLLDPEHRGYIMREDFEKVMMEIGEPFSTEEINNMMAIACDPETKQINYEHYINLLLVKIPESLNVYSIADAMEAARLEAMPKKPKLDSLLLTYQ
ncbi:dynein regulatory complex protein 8 isoform X1 [Apis mellifera carnica]|uniref:Dynein regulatory complex protein 8 isoform X1 n=1 Tax=Apis mellifera TaxID=7460 RepID=A0A7M7TFE0_APIME|nr:dynein regulatory complex protein 8 isoform X1 [Apis mellifera]KAG9434914.1 dynein regulatory complex protein 8 isoform X1 [Apis mellifera carnica]|eukprot:XP_396212.2 dynein regulatory complex protein 8 isoform X1 [Apis mellifera]